LERGHAGRSDADRLVSQHVSLVKFIVAATQAASAAADQDDELFADLLHHDVHTSAHPRHLLHPQPQSPASDVVHVATRTNTASSSVPSGKDVTHTVSSPVIQPPISISSSPWGYCRMQEEGGGERPGLYGSHRSQNDAHARHTRIPALDLVAAAEGGVECVGRHRPSHDSMTRSREHWLV